jgi:hypothetical protein
MVKGTGDVVFMPIELGVKRCAGKSALTIESGPPADGRAVILKEVMLAPEIKM